MMHSFALHLAAALTLSLPGSAAMHSRIAPAMPRVAATSIILVPTVPANSFEGSGRSRTVPRAVTILPIIGLAEMVALGLAIRLAHPRR